MNNIYYPLWNKYRPVILKMMLASDAEEQHYTLFAHEFRACNAKEKTYSFTLQTKGNKAVNNIKLSQIARDLLEMLDASKKGSELLQENTFEFTLDKRFVLRVVKHKLQEATSQA
jgi:hypothetical protein